jgi:hypothetical protein
MSQLQATMSSIDAQTVWLGLDATALQLQAAARAAGLVDEGIDAYRSDALVAWANHALADPKAPRRHGRRQQVQFITDLPSLLGFVDNPAELVGYGPIPVALVRDRAATADWVRLMVDPITGYLLDYGKGIYRPPAELADYVMARDRRCRFPAATPVPPSATSTTTSPPPAATPRHPTAAVCAADTTGSKPSPAGP